MPTTQVLRAFERQKVIPRDRWLDFHDKYAGYVEEIGLERAVWGLVHVAAQWQKAMEIWIEGDDAETLIACADVHPSFDYRLTETGEFLGIGGGGPCESFDIKVEQNALVWSVTRHGTWEKLMDFNARSDKEKNDVLLDTRLQVVPEATDKYTTCLLSPTCLVFRRKRGFSVWIEMGSASPSNPSP